MKHLITAFLLTLVMLLPTSAFANGALLVLDTTSHFRPVWNDKGSGADRDGAFYRPRLPEGFFSIGDYGQSNYNTPRRAVVVVKAINDDPRDPLLKPPVDYALIWKDTGSGASKDGSFWQPVPPDGYVCIGSVVQHGYSKPHRPDYRCLRYDQVERGEIAGLIWNDRGSGADRDVEIFALGGTNVIYAQDNYSEPAQTLWQPRDAR